MKKRAFIWILACLPLIVVTTCKKEDKSPTGGGSPPTDGYTQLMVCTQECMEDMYEYLQGFTYILQQIYRPGIPVPLGYIYNPATGEIRFEVDFDGEDPIENVHGDVVSSYDIENGLDSGEAAAVVWWVKHTFTEEVLAAGTWALIMLDFDTMRWTLTELDSSYVDPFFKSDDCRLEITALGLHLDRIRNIDPARPWGTVTTGTVEFTTTVGPRPTEEKLSCFTVLGDSDTLTVYADYKGEDRQFQFDLTTFTILN